MAAVLFGGEILWFGVAPLNVEPAIPENVEAAVTALREAGERAGRVWREGKDVLQRYDEAYSQVRAADIGLLLDAAGVPYSPSDFGLSTKNAAKLAESKASADAQRKQARQELAPVFEAIQQRVDTALGLARHPDVRPQLEAHEALLQDSRSCAETIRAIEGCWPMLVELNRLMDQLSILAARAEPGHSEQEPLQRQRKRITGELRDLLQRVILRFTDTPYPFRHVEGQVSVAQHLTHEAPGARLGPQGYAEAASARLTSLYARSWGDLAVLVKQVERDGVSLPDVCFLRVGPSLVL